MSRFEGDLTAAADAQLREEDLLELMGHQDSEPRNHNQAIACYLSGGEGWREAMKTLDGAFANKAVATVRLKSEKIE